MIQDAAGASVRRIGRENLSLAMGTRPEDASRLSGTRRDRDLLHDHSRLLVRGGRRASDLAGVVRPCAKSEKPGEGDGKDPIDDPGHETPDAKDPRRGRDEVEGDEQPDGKGAEPMEPLRLV